MKPPALLTFILSAVMLVPMTQAEQSAPGDAVVATVDTGTDNTENSTGNAETSRPGEWGIAIGLRRADIAYATDKGEVYDILPLLQFENEYVFIKGLEGGVHLWQNDQHQINVYTRFRFVDIPKEFQNEIKEEAFDFGLQYRFIKGLWEADIAFLSDSYERSYGYTRAQYHWSQGDWDLMPFAELKWKSADFNDYYYGLEQYSPGAGVSLNTGVKGRYHVTSNLYLLGQFAVNRLEDDIAGLPVIDNRYQLESFLGFGFFPAPGQRYAGSSGKIGDEFLRIAYGWATPSDIGEILKFRAESDPYNNQMTSLFYGTQLTDELFTLPLDIYFTPGAVWHHSSDVQNNLAEGVIAIKAFYTFEFGPRWRVGLAEGLSYVSSVTYIEGSELEGKDYGNTSKLLNYLDFSFDVNLGDVFDNPNMAKLWLGYSVHHRSGIFETSSAFGRIKGGSNYQTVYLQWHF